MVKTFPLAGLAVILVLILCGGCRSPEAMRRPQAVEREFTAEPEAVLAAARQVLVEEGFRIRRSGVGKSELEALTPVRTDGAFREASQMRARMRVEPASPAGTRVRLMLTLLEEAEIPVHGVATHETAVRSPYAYDRIFDRVAVVLGERDDSGR
jgi:hypothetical protein